MNEYFYGYVIIKELTKNFLFIIYKLILILYRLYKYKNIKFNINI